MCAKIVSLNKNYDQLALARHRARLLAFAAHQFALCVLWPEKTFSEENGEHARAWIQYYLEKSGNSRKAFISLCERVVLTQRCRGENQSPELLSPAFWFSPFCKDGFSASFSLFSSVRSIRKVQPDYLRHIQILATMYYRYVTQPSARQVERSKKQLVRMEAYSLLGYFYAAIDHLQYNVA